MKDKVVIRDDDEGKEESWTSERGEKIEKKRGEERRGEEREKRREKREKREKRGGATCPPLLGPKGCFPHHLRRDGEGCSVASDAHDLRGGGRKCLYTPHAMVMVHTLPPVLASASTSHASGGCKPTAIFPSKA
jgi:hypothetical protein